MKIKKLSIIALSIMASSLANASNSDMRYVMIQDEMEKKIIQRISELQEYAASPDYYFYRDGKKMIEINEVVYEINESGNVKMPAAHFADESAIRNIFDFFDKDWELSNYSGGAVFVNKKFGNYNYGQGCLLEYFLDGTVSNENTTCTDGSMDEAHQNNNSDVDFFYPSEFGVSLEYADFTAVEEYNDKLIVSQSPNAKDSQYSNAVVSILEMDTRKNIKTIRGINENEPYVAIDDLYRHGSNLYISAIKAHGRIDVYDLDKNEFLYSFKVDIKSKDGVSVIADEKYIYVAAPEKLTVYPNSKLGNGEIKQLLPFAFLDYHGEPVRHMELIGDKLLANSVSSSSVYDVNALTEGETRKAMVTGLQGFESIDLHNDNIVVKNPGRLEIHSVERFIKNNYHFTEADKATYQIDGNPVSADDLIIRDNNVITLKDFAVTRVHKFKSIKFLPDVTVEEKKLKFNELDPSSVYSVLGDNLSSVSLSYYKINMSSLVDVKFINANTVEITNYTEFDLDNVDLNFKANDQYNWARLANIDYFPAYTRITLNLSSISADNKFNTVDGSGVFDYDEMINDDYASSGTTGDFSLTTKFKSQFKTTTANEAVQKLSEITADWAINFGKDTVIYDGDKNWTPKIARQWLKIWANMAYVLSSDKFAHHWLNFKEIYGYDMSNVAGHNGAFDAETYKKYLLSMQRGDLIMLRMDTKMNSGGGVTGQVGSVFAIPDDQYQKLLSGDMKTFASFLGKLINRNYTLSCMPTPCNWPYNGFLSENMGFAPMFVDVVTQMSESGDLPYLNK